ncbi:MAG: hypothetical protein HQL68_01425 [Magnetococcales bacterium]|nr:hypothetical protein [Magnetococcales bacterium]
MKNFFYIAICIITLLCTPAHSFADGLEGKLGEYWNKTKEYSRSIWDDTEDLRKDGLDKSKQYGKKGWEKTKELSEKGWEKSKKYSEKQWEKSKEYLEKHKGEKNSEEGKKPPHQVDKNLQKQQIDL